MTNVLQRVDKTRTSLSGFFRPRSHNCCDDEAEEEGKDTQRENHDAYVMGKVLKKSNEDLLSTTIAETKTRNL